MEVYFWSLIVAISIFAVGGGMSIYEGITHIIHPSPLETAYINYIVLGPVDGLREPCRSRWPGGPSRPTGARAASWPPSAGAKTPACSPWSSKTPPPSPGLVVAFIGVLLSHLLDMPELDGAASVVIG